MTKAEKSRIFWNSILLIIATLWPLFLFLAVRAVSGNPVAWTTTVAMGALLIILGLVGRRRKQLSVPPNSGAVTRSFDTPLFACVYAGAIIGFLLTFVASIESLAPLSDSGDTVTPVASTYSVFGVAVAESAVGPVGG